MPNYMKEFKKRGLTLTEFARRAGVSPTYISMIFKGKAEPSEEIADRIEALLSSCPWCGSKWPHPIPATKRK